MNRRSALKILVLPPCAAWVGCSTKQAPKQSVRLKTSASYYLSNCSFFLANEEGYFRDRGIDLEIVQLRNSGEMIPLLASGEIDAALFAFSPSFFNAVGKGARMKLVAGRERLGDQCLTASATLYVRHKDFPNGLADLKALKGKRITISRRTAITEYFLDLMLEKSGMTGADVKVSAMGHPEAIAAMKIGAIDAMLGLIGDSRPGPENAGLALGPTVQQFYPNLQFSHVVFGQRLLNMDESVGAGFLAAHLRGCKEFLAGKTPRFMSEYLEKAQWPKEVINTYCRPTFDPTGNIDIQSLALYRNWGLKKGYITESVDDAKLIDLRFLNAARRMV